MNILDTCCDPFGELFNGWSDDNDDNMLDKDSKVIVSVKPVFLIVDISGGMWGRKIEEVKAFVESIKERLDGFNRDLSNDRKFLISILCIGDSPYWQAWMEEPSRVASTFIIQSMFNMGGAFSELEHRLSDQHLMGMEFNIKEDLYVGYAERPVFVLITNNEFSTDNVEDSINRLKSNEWFYKGDRVAIALNKDSDTMCLEKFTGSRNTVLRTDDNLPWKEILIEFILCAADTTRTIFLPWMGGDCWQEAYWNYSVQNSKDILVASLESLCMKNCLSEDEVIKIIGKATWEE